jgi:shikimate kinase
MLIYLIGYMGSGKTTIGPRLAHGLGFQFLDLDVYIEERYKLSIKDFFQKYGEEKFRKIENQSLIETFKLRNHVISTGGGTACFYNNLNLINQHGVSVYLKLTPEILAHRLKNSRKPRPLVKDCEPSEFKIQIAEHLKLREPFYQQATYIVDANRTDFGYLVNILKQRIREA